LLNKNENVSVGKSKIFLQLKDLKKKKVLVRGSRGWGILAVPVAGAARGGRVVPTANYQARGALPLSWRAEKSTARLLGGILSYPLPSPE